MPLPLTRRRLLAAALLASVGVAPAGCLAVRLAADYDAQVDQGATTLQKRMDAHLTRLSALPSGDAARRYPGSRQFYLDYGVELRALGTRAASQPKNERTVQQFVLMERSVESLRATHQRQDTLSAGYLAQAGQLFRGGWQAVITYELAKKRRAGGRPAGPAA